MNGPAAAGSASPVQAGGRAPSVVVAGMLGGDPHQGGALWATLQWVLGLRQLGCTVTVLDQLAPGRMVTPAVTQCAGAVAKAFGLDGSLVVFDDAGGRHGPDPADLARRLAAADVVLNLSGRLRHLEPVAHVPVRVFVDLDPGFVQVWAAQGHDFGLAHHTHFRTVGQAIGTPAWRAPDLGLPWQPVLPPVVLSHWPQCPPPPPSLRRATTVANWRSYGSAWWDGVALGQKAHSFRGLAGLPARAPVAVEVALDIHPDERADHALLTANGWRLVDPVAVAGTPDAYRRYVQGSWAELGVAKQGYVTARTGWISDRTAAYLASGRPAVLQDTGPHPLHGRDGVVCFDDLDGAVAALAAVAGDYERHARGARELACELFDARRVLPALLDGVGA